MRGKQRFCYQVTGSTKYVFSVLIVNKSENIEKYIEVLIKQFFNRVWTYKHIFFVQYESNVWISIGYVDIIVHFVSLDIWSKQNL